MPLSFHDAKWRVTKHPGGQWFAFKRYSLVVRGSHVVPRTANLFPTWDEAMDWAHNDRRRDHA